MVISYFGALNAFLAIYQNLPAPVRLLFDVTFLVLGAAAVIVRIVEL